MFWRPGQVRGYIPPLFLHSAINFLRGLARRPLASASLVHSRAYAVVAGITVAGFIAFAARIGGGAGWAIAAIGVRTTGATAIDAAMPIRVSFFNMVGVLSEGWPLVAGAMQEGARQGVHRSAR